MNYQEATKEENVTEVQSNISSNTEPKFSHIPVTPLPLSSNIFQQRYLNYLHQKLTENSSQEKPLNPFSMRFFPLHETFYPGVRHPEVSSRYSTEDLPSTLSPALALLQCLQYQQAIRNYYNHLFQCSNDNPSSSNFAIRKEDSLTITKESELDERCGTKSTRFILPVIIEGSLSDKILSIEVELANYLCNLHYSSSPVKYISNPIDHAYQPHKMFLEKYLDGEKTVLFLGMNPGPWGMCQTGVPFGDISSCESFLGIEAEVNKAVAGQHPKRPIQGFSCKRKEVSGSRFWAFVKSICLSPENFFKSCFVLNYCPLAFMKDSGKNIGPAELGREVRDKVNQACDVALHKILVLLNTKFVVGVGKFAEARAKSVTKEYNLDIGIGSLMHPSPINPAANKGWDNIAYKTIQDLGLLSLLKPN